MYHDEEELMEEKSFKVSDEDEDGMFEEEPMGDFREDDDFDDDPDSNFH